MKRTVTKIFRFDSAHRLFRYEGKCSNLHGHTYVAEVELTAKELDNQDILIDFGAIKQEIGEWIDRWWDHAVLLNSEDPFSMVCGDNKAFYFTEMNPTAEVMAEHLFGVAELAFPDGVVQVKIWETPTSFASYKKER